MIKQVKVVIHRANGSHKGERLVDAIVEENRIELIEPITIRNGETLTIEGPHIILRDV